VPHDPIQRRTLWIRQQRAQVNPLAMFRTQLKIILWAVPPVVLLLMAFVALLLRLFVQDRMPGLLAYVYYAASPAALAGAVLAAGLWWLIPRHFKAALPTLVVALVAASFVLVTMFRFNPPRSPSSEPIRILYWNVAHGVRGWPDIAAAIRGYDADLVGLVEAGGDSGAMTTVWAQHLPEYQVAAYDTGITVLSRRPLRVVTASSRETWSRYVHATIDVDQRPLHFVVFDILHTIGLSRDVAFGPLYEALEPLNGHAVVIGGDFNTPADSVYLERLRRTYDNAFETAGQGYAATWPVPLPLLTIDQAWASSAVRLLNCRHGWSTLSDHRPVILEVSLEPPPASAPATRETPADQS
jgi:endonuclease/exonuclease/phosphatase (EEP) superfamily protein YafD